MAMSDIAQIEKEVLGLSPAEREQLALKMWESIIADEAATADPNLDSDGVKIARSRDLELESGRVSSITEKEFIAHTGGK